MNDDRAYLLHIRDAIASVREYTKGGRDEFFARKIVQDAVIRNLEVIGEATKQLSHDAKSRQPGVPWKNIAGMRDILIHHYFGVDLAAVWEVVDQHLEPLSESVECLLADSD